MAIQVPVKQQNSTNKTKAIRWLRMDMPNGSSSSQKGEEWCSSLDECFRLHAYFARIFLDIAWGS